MSTVIGVTGGSRGIGAATARRRHAGLPDERPTIRHDAGRGRGLDRLFEA
jgi:hypothetical protein